MDWIFLVLILAFTFWGFQMIMAFRRQLARYDSQVNQLRESMGETKAQADRYASENEGRQHDLDAAREEVQRLEEKERTLKGRVAEMRKGDPRRPTRHRVELPPEDA